jgi:hypothetical protein
MIVHIIGAKMAVVSPSGDGHDKHYFLILKGSA